MRYRLNIDEQVIDVDWSIRPEHLGALAWMHGREYQVRGKQISAQELRLEVNGQAAWVFWATAPEGRYIFIGGHVFWIKDAAPISPRKKHCKETGPLALGHLSPPMPSVVVRILVSKGDKVTAGQGLVVVSAMKMETVLTAPRDGIVRRINTKLEAKVVPGDLLIEIEESGCYE